MDERGRKEGVTIFRRNFVVPQFVGQPLCFRKIRATKNFMHKRGKEGITVPRRKIFVTAPTLFKEKSLCQKNAGIEKCKELEREEGQREILVSEKCWYRKM